MANKELEEKLGAFALAALDQATAILKNPALTGPADPSFMKLLDDGLQTAARLGLPNPFAPSFPVEARSPTIPLLPNADKFEEYMDKMGGFVDQMMGKRPESEEHLDAEPID